MTKFLFSLVFSVLGLCSNSIFTENDILTDPSCGLSSVYSSSNAVAATQYYISSECYGAISKEALNALVRNLNKNDIKSAEKQLARGELVPLDKGTLVDLLDYGLSTCKVKITSGSYKGKVVYVITEFLGKR